MNRSRILITIGLWAVTCARVDSAVAETPGAGERVVKRFDFDERPLGNLESIPMLWRKHRAVGFPDYASGHLDESMGHEAAPSFYVELDGRSCAYTYTGFDITIEPRSDYRLVGFIKTDRLRSARAFLSAVFLDANGQPLPDSERRTPLVARNDVWSEVVIRMPSNVGAAHTLSVTAWVVQQEVWSTAPRRVGHIDRKDVHGGAWFDDILVYRLPSVELTTSAEASGHLYEPDQDPVLRVKLGESSWHGARATLTVQPKGAPQVWQDTIESQPGRGRPYQEFVLSTLPPGVYDANLTVHVDSDAVQERALTFIKMARVNDRRVRFKNRFGVILDAGFDGTWSAPAALIDGLDIKPIKIVLPGTALIDHSSAVSDLEDFVQQRVSAHNTLAVVLTGPRDVEGGTLIDRFSRPQDTWAPMLTHLVTRYEGLINAWQLGPDGPARGAADERLPAVFDVVHKLVSQLTSASMMAVPWSVHHTLPRGQLDKAVLSLHVPTDVLPEEIPAYIDGQFGDRGRRVWAVLDMPALRSYHRLPAIVDFAKRLIFAQQSGAEIIFVNQPWRSTVVSNRIMTVPTEEYAVLRAIVDMFDDAEYIGPLDLANDVVCHAYDRHGQALLVLWDEQAPPAGREHDLFLCGADEMTDLWGRTLPLIPAGENHRIRLSGVPVIVHPAETWLVQFVQGLRFDPELLPSQSTAHELNIRIHNPENDPISGSLKLQAPRRWRLRPTHVSFAIQPHETMVKPVFVQSAPREPAGTKLIEARVNIDATPRYEFDITMPLKLDLADMDVWADLFIDGTDLVLRHGVTNRSDEIVTFRSMADAPGRKRLNVNIIGLRPGQSAMKVHVFENARELSGSAVRVGLKQIKGPRVHDLALEVP